VKLFLYKSTSEVFTIVACFHFITFSFAQSIVFGKLCMKWTCLMHTCRKYLCLHIWCAYAMHYKGISIVAKSHPGSEARNLDGWAVRAVCHPPWPLLSLIVQSLRSTVHVAQLDS